MDTLRIVQFDIHGKNPVNKFDRSEIKIKDKTCPWVIPDGSPFFGDYPAPGQLPLTVIYDERGAELVRDRDYWLEEEFIPLVEVTGRPIVCFIRLSDEVRENNSLIKASYQSVGAYFVPRNSMEEWLEQMKKGIIPVPWSKVFGVPPTLPPEWHSHSAKTEIADWFELTWFYTYVAGIVSTRDPNVAIELEAAIRQAFDQLYQLRNQQQLALKNHDMDYNVPHGTNAASVNMGNHPNYRTATVPEQRAGTSSTTLSTPQGVQETLKDFMPDTDDAMRSGILPISKFSNSGYIPPTITGSFEGLGSISECMGICLEEDGRVVVLQNHFDGRTQGLYFSVLKKGYDRPYDPKDPYVFDYTVYKYAPPVLANIGAAITSIVAGSGNDVIMTGVTTVINPAQDDQWFVALTNNSFDPSGHRYIKTNMANVWAQCGNPLPGGIWPGGYQYHGRMTINLLGQWVYLTVDAVPTLYQGTQGRIVLFRIPKQALIDGTPATWQLVPLTYQDWDGVQYNGKAFWEFAQKQVNNGLMYRWGRYNFPTPIPSNSGVGYFGRRFITLYAPKPGTTNIFYMNMVVYTFLEYNVPGQSLNVSATITNMVYELNVDTGAMVNIYKQPLINVDYATSDATVALTDRNLMMDWYAPTVRYLYPATVVLPRGDLLMSYTGASQEESVLNSLIAYRQYKDAQSGQVFTSKSDLLKGSLSTNRITLVKGYEKYRSVRTPIPIGVGARHLAYEAGGENVMVFDTVVKDLAAPNYTGKIVCRNVSGGYALRAPVFNVLVPNVYSRPLVNTAYDTNMSYKEPVISVSGSAAELDGRGTECGNMSLSVVGWSAKSLAYPANTDILSVPSNAFKATNAQGAFLTFPKTYSRVLDAATQVMRYTPTAFYGLSAGVHNKIRSIIPGAKQGAFWSYSLWMLNAESGPMFQGLDTALLHIKYPTDAAGMTDSWDAQVIYVRPIVEAPNAAHPGCYLITDFQILGTSIIYKQHFAINSGSQGAHSAPENRGSLQLYRNGNVAQVALASPFICLGGNAYPDLTLFDLNLATGAVNNIAGLQNQWQYGDVVTNIPRVGRTQATLSAPDTYNATITNVPTPDTLSRSSGAAAKIFPAGGVNYAVITSYPETGWAIFFLEEVELMINGTMHRMPTGLVDLRDFDPAPQNKTFWIYATIFDEKGRYILSDTKLRQNGKMIHACTVTTGPNQILTIQRRQPFMIGDLELSYSRKGGSIPVSSGFPQDDGNFTFLRAAELLP